MKKNKINNKLRKDIVSKLIIFIFASFSIISLITMGSLILKEAIPAYKEYGFFHMYFSADFSEEGGFGIWSALVMTLITSVVSVAISLPLSLRTAIFIRFRTNNFTKPLRIIVNTLSGIPSVVLGIFAIKSLNNVSSLFSGNSQDPSTLINSIFMLSIMIFPTMTSLIYNQLKMVDLKIMNASMALGNTKTYSIYKVIKKSIRQGIYVSIITALGRAIGETMALSMILTSPSSMLGGSFNEVLNSSFATLGVEISRQMFQDGTNELTRSALFAAGIALFFVIMILVGVVTKLSKTRRLKPKNPLRYKKIFIIEKYPSKLIMYIHIFTHTLFLPFSTISFLIYIFMERMNQLWTYISYWVLLPYSLIVYSKKRENELTSKYFERVSKSKISKTPDYIRILFEFFSIIIVFGSAIWIIGDVLFTGIPKWRSQDWLFSYKNSVGKKIAGDIMNPLIWTIVLIEITIFISIPFSIGTALFLSEYARDKKIGNFVKFFLDSLGGTPSILFGIFGSIFFLDTLGLRRQVGSTSLLAGALTMFLVILPTFTRSVEQVLINIPDSMRHASYALGASKFETIRKIILPESLPGISAGIVLSVGRVISETAPIYLTLGMFSGVRVGLLEPGHTLTTDILENQVFSSLNSSDALEKSYKLASVAIILVTTITIVSSFIDTKKMKKKRKR